MLTAQQRNEFDRYGFVRMPGAIAKSAAEEMPAMLWSVAQSTTFSDPETGNDRSDGDRCS
jgi:hypothetical protein